MKKIIFCLQTMVLGGVEKELITVLKKIHNQYDITLLLLYAQDEKILKELPASVKLKVLDIDRKMYTGSTVQLVNQRLKKGKIGEAVSVAVKRLLKIGMTSSNINIDNIPSESASFDTAICYHIHSPLMLKYVATKIKATKKIGWIHNEFYAVHYPVQRLKKYINMYDEFVAVSGKVKREFCDLCPWYKGKTSVAYNYLDDAEIIKLSEFSIDDESFLSEKSVKILTVGRFTEQKGIDLAILAAAMLKKEGKKFHWFLIGYGELEDFYLRLIEQYDVGDCFTILGKKTNPYPYFKNCDIYVQPSRHEAFGLVILEAKILKRPIICTNFDGADEQIVNGKNGIIVPLNDVNALFGELSKLISSPEERFKLSSTLEQWSPQDDLKEIIKHF